MTASETPTGRADALRAQGEVWGAVRPFLTRFDPATIGPPIPGQPNTREADRG